MKTGPIAPFREDRQYGEPYADNEQVYRTIGLTSAQLGRLPKWTRLAIARADATINRRDKTIADLLAALEWALEMQNVVEATLPPGYGTPKATLAWMDHAKAAVAKATGDA